MTPGFSVIEQKTGELYGELWPEYDDEQFLKSVTLFGKRWAANGEPADFFHKKQCLDVGCGGGRYSFAMAMMGAESVVGVDLSEAGIADARRRGVKLGFRNVSFERGSALQLPFRDAQFDFVCCSGVLHHTASVERGASEIFRVLKPGGWAYFLLYGAGGLFWPLNYLMRAFADLVGQEEVERGITNGDYPANKRRVILDDLFVPILETYPRDRVERILRDAGFDSWHFWKSGQLDHEQDANAMLAEMRARLRFWQAAAVSNPDTTSALAETHALNISRAVVAAVSDLIEQNRLGYINNHQLHEAVIGHGHHRFIAQK